MTHVSREPLVSVLTPSLNQGRWLVDNLASVASQTYPELEHVVVDGGSGDKSLDVLRSSDGRVRWSSEPDQGQSDALNIAYRKSRGSIIGWLNADDAYFQSGVVKAAVDLFIEHPAVEVIYGHCAIINADGMLLHFRWAPPFSHRRLLVNNFIYQPTVFIRRSALSSGFLVDGSYRYTMDRELWLRLANEGRRFQRIDRVMAIDREHTGRKSYAGREAMRAEREAVDLAYGAPQGRLVGIRRYLTNIGFRLRGATLVRRLGEPDCVPLSGVSGLQLLRRQIAVRRRHMPFGT